jgi:hypothetical protein
MNPNKKKSKEKDDFCKKMGLGLKMLIQKESRKNLKTYNTKPSKAKAQLVKKNISKKAKEDKIKQIKRRRGQLEQKEKTFRLSQKFQDLKKPEKEENFSNEPLNERIKRLIESVSGEKTIEKREDEIRLQDLVNDGIITPSIIPRLGGEETKAIEPDPNGIQEEEEEDLEETNRRLEEEIEKTGILETLLVENPEDFLCVFEQMQAMEDKKKEDEVEQIKTEKEKGITSSKDPFWVLEQKVAAKLNMKMDKLKQKRNTYEYKMEKLKRDGKRFIFRRHERIMAKEPVLDNKQGRDIINPIRNRKEILSESSRNKEKNRRFGIR